MIGTPLGYIMWPCYLLVQNVGLAIVIFTFIVKAAMFPINLKQQKKTAISQLFTPKVREIQTKYKNNPQKQQEELVKLQKEGYNPAGGCLPLLLTFILLGGVIDVVYKPMTHMEHFDGASINAIVASAKKVDIAETLLASPDDYTAVLEYLKDESTVAFVEEEKVDEEGKKYKVNNRITHEEGFNLDAAKKTVAVTQADIDVLGVFATDQNKLNVLAGNSKLSNEVRTALTVISNNYADAMLYRELRTLNCYDRSEANKQLIVSLSGIDSDTAARLENLSRNMYIFGQDGINLGEQPTWAWNTLLIIPILSFVLSLAQFMVSQYYMKKQNPEMAQMQGGMTAMFLIMPVVSLLISFSVPAGAGFYWGLSYLFGMLQSVITYKFWPSDKIRAEAKAKMEAAAAKKEQRATVVTVDAEGNAVEKTERLSQLTQKEIKELNRKKLEAARRADAEKYGEEYKEFPDDDF